MKTKEQGSSQQNANTVDKQNYSKKRLDWNHGGMVAETTAETEVHNEKISQEEKNVIEYEEVEGVFRIYGSEEEGYYLLMGNNRLTEKMTYSEVVADSKRDDWQRRMQIMMIVAEHVKKEK